MTYYTKWRGYRNLQCNILICKLLVVNPAYAIRHSRRRYFSGDWNLSTWLRSTMTQERFSNLKVLNSQKERTAKFAPLPPPPPSTTSKEVVTGPRTLKTAPRALLYCAFLFLVCNPVTRWPCHVRVQYNKQFLEVLTWKWCLVPIGEKHFSSWSPQWPPWRHV